MSALVRPYLDARARLAALTDGLEPRLFNRKPSASGWSAGECVVHLNRTAAGYLPAFERLAGTLPPGEGPFRYGWLARRFIEAVRPGSRALPTAGAMKPPAATGRESDVDPDAALRQFNDDMDRLVAVARRLEGRDLTAVRMRSPFLPALRLPLGAFVEALGLHACRHVEQAERAVAAAREGG